MFNSPAQSAVLPHQPARRVRLAGVALAASSLLLALPASATDLAEVYERAKTYDADFQAALFDYEAAKQRVPLAKSAFRPQLAAGFDASLNWVDSDLSGTSLTGASLDSHDQFFSTNLNLSLSQTLFNRANSRLLDQAELGVMQAEAQYESLSQGLILRVATAYFDVLRAQANVEFSQSELQAISRQREQAERRFDVGLVPITDVRSAQAQYDLAVAQEIAASNSLSTAREALLVISGTEAELLAPLADDLPLVSPEPADIDAWVNMAIDQNLDLVIARLATDSALLQVDVDRAARYPTVDLVGIGASQTTEASGRPDTDSAELRLQLRLPLLTGGRVKAQIAQSKAQADSSAQQLLSRERAATQQARDSYRGVQASISLVRALRQALVSTQKAAEATDAGFRAGTRTSVDVLQALRDTYRARSDYAGVRYDFVINTLNLKAAAGTLNEADVQAINRFLQPVE